MSVPGPCGHDSGGVHGRRGGPDGEAETQDVVTEGIALRGKARRTRRAGLVVLKKKVSWRRSGSGRTLLGEKNRRVSRVRKKSWAGVLFRPVLR